MLLLRLPGPHVHGMARCHPLPPRQVSCSSTSKSVTQSPWHGPLTPVGSLIRCHPFTSKQNNQAFCCVESLCPPGCNHCFGVSEAKPRCSRTRTARTSNRSTARSRSSSLFSRPSILSNWWPLSTASTRTSRASTRFWNSRS